MHGAGNLHRLVDDLVAVLEQTGDAQCTRSVLVLRGALRHQLGGVQHAVAGDLTRADGGHVVAERCRHAAFIAHVQLLCGVAVLVVDRERQHVVVRGVGILHHVARHLDFLVRVLPRNGVGDRGRLRGAGAADDGQDHDQHDDDDAGDRHHATLRPRIHRPSLFLSVPLLLSNGNHIENDGAIPSPR